MAAYDFNVLINKLKARGLDVAEDTVKGITEDVFTFVEESIKESSTPFDDIILVVLPVVKASLLKLEDTIDGAVGLV